MWGESGRRATREVRAVSVLGDNYRRGAAGGGGAASDRWMAARGAGVACACITLLKLQMRIWPKKYSMSPPKHYCPPRGPGSPGYCMATSTRVGFCLSQMAPVLMGLLFNSSPSLPKAGSRGFLSRLRLTVQKVCTSSTGLGCFACAAKRLDGPLLTPPCPHRPDRLTSPW